MSKYILLLLLLFISNQSLIANNEQDSIQDRKRFFHFSISQNPYNDSSDRSTNFSGALLFGHEKNVFGLAIAPFNAVDSLMYGLQLGVANGATSVKGVQIGMANGTKYLKGIQIGMINMIDEESGGIQLGVANVRQSSGIQVGLLNIADHNDYPIGFVNIIKDGDMQVGLATDEMSNVMATFRSGGKYLYGVTGLGYSFSSSIGHMVLKFGIGAHLLRTKCFKLNAESTFTHLGRARVDKGDDEKKSDDFDSKSASRLSFRIMPSISVTKKIELFGGPSINYLHSKESENTKIFPSHYVWRKFKDNSFKQIYYGWTVGLQYKL